MDVIYRIQDSDGRGPWKPGFSHRWVEDRPDHDNLPPWIIEFWRIDRKLLVGECAGSGCRTIEQLRRWFSKSEYKTLLSYGYRAVRMEVNRILGESEIQLFFGRATPLNQDVIGIKLYD